MSSRKNQQRKIRVHTFECLYGFSWEDAFNKFGYADGDECLTFLVVNALSDAGYVAEKTAWGCHNEIIVSIIKDDREYMPTGNSSVSIGYDNPRKYLPRKIIRLLDERFYD